MEVRGQHHYDADVDQVFKTFASREYIQAKYTKLGSRNIEIIRCEQTPDSLELEVLREVPVDAPAMLKKFVGEWNQLRQTEHWQSKPGEGYHCTTHIEIKGVPVTINGTMDLRPDGAGSVNQVVLKVDSKVPLVGGKLADFAGASTREAMQQEYEFLTQYLAHYA